MVVDMDWHKAGWTGYSWCPAFFPRPDQFLSDLKERGLKITLNLHPADGVGKHEDQFEEVCRDMGLNPAKTERVDFDCVDPKFIGLLTSSGFIILWRLRRRLLVEGLAAGEQDQDGRPSIRCLG
jgi:hypothetical protein